MSLSSGDLSDTHRQIAIGNLLGGGGDFVHGCDQLVHVGLDGVKIAFVRFGD
jgi:hypothetical protein